MHATASSHNRRCSCGFCLVLCIQPSTLAIRQSNLDFRFCFQLADRARTSCYTMTSRQMPRWLHTHARGRDKSREPNFTDGKHSSTSTRSNLVQRHLICTLTHNNLQYVYQLSTMGIRARTLARMPPSPLQTCVATPRL